MYDTDRMLCLPLLHLLYKTVNAEVDLSQVLQAWSLTCCLYQHTKITRLSDAVVLKYQDHPKAPNWQLCWQCAHWADGIYLNLEQYALPIGQMCFLFELFPLWGFWFGRKQTWFFSKRCFRFLPNILLCFNYSLMFFFLVLDSNLVFGWITPPHPPPCLTGHFTWGLQLRRRGAAAVWFAFSHTRQRIMRALYCLLLFIWPHMQAH